MRFLLDQPVRSGATIVASVIRYDVRSGERGGSIFGHAKKSPAAVLIHVDGATTALDLTGKTISAAQFDQHFPGTRSEFENLVRDMV